MGRKLELLNKLIISLSKLPVMKTLLNVTLVGVRSGEEYLLS